MDAVAECTAVDVAETRLYATLSSRLYPRMSLAACLRSAMTEPLTARMRILVAVSAATCRSMSMSSVSKARLILAMAESILKA